MDRLPSDVLELILGLLTTHQRLRYASFVCKRWRAAAINATTDFAPAKALNVPAASRVLTCVERLTLGGVPEASLAEGAFPRLRSLTISSLDSTVSSASLASPEGVLRLLERTTLTELNLSDVSRDLWAERVRPCAPSLTSLALGVFAPSPDFRLLDLDFPRLTSLQFYVSVKERYKECFASALQRLLQRTHTQLEVLAIATDSGRLSCLWERLDATFPRLRSVSLVRPAASSKFLHALARCHPSMRLALEPSPLCLAQRTLLPTPQLLPFLTSLNVAYFPAVEPESLLAALAQGTCITSLTLRNGNGNGRHSCVVELFFAQDAHLATKVTALEMVGTPASVATLPAFPRLATLFVHTPLLTLPDPSIRLSSVTRLEAFFASIAALRDALRCFPGVRHLVARQDPYVDTPWTKEECAAFIGAHAQLETCVFHAVVADTAKIDTPWCRAHYSARA